MEQFLNGFCAHAHPEGRAVFTEFILVFCFGQQLFFGQVGIARIQDNVAGKVQDFFQGSLANVQDSAHPAGNSLEIPDMGYGSSQFNGAHPIAADLGASNFYTAFVADDPFITDAFVLAAMAFPILGRSKNPFAEQTIPFRFQGSIVDRFRFGYFPVGPRSDLFGRGQADTHRMKFIYV